MPNKWSEWVWDKDRARYYRYRYKSNGDPEYEWDTRDYGKSPEQDSRSNERDARLEDDIDNITRRTQELPLSDQSAGEHVYEQSSSSSGHRSDVPSKSKHKDKHKSRRRDKEYYDEHAYEDTSRTSRKSSDRHRTTTEYARPSGSSSRHPGYHSTPIQDYASASGKHGRSTVYHQTPSKSHPTEDYSESLDHVRSSTTYHGSSADYHGSSTGYLSSSAHSSADHAGAHIQNSYEYRPSGSQPMFDSDVQVEGDEEDDFDVRRPKDPAYGLTYNRYSEWGETGESSRSAYGPLEEVDEDRAATPRPTRRPVEVHTIQESSENDIGAELDQLDPRYRIQPSAKFQPGEIFLVNWAEPQGDNVPRGAPTAEVSGKQVLHNRLGAKFYVGFRRFIVIANDEGHSTCVPILTYGGKGCTKSGVKALKHGIIHQVNKKARMVSNEPDLGFRPVRANLYEEGESLAKESRVNYAKLVTVEHNVKVFFIGQVLNGDFGSVQDAVDDCWNQKGHKRKKNQHRR